MPNPRSVFGLSLRRTSTPINRAQPAGLLPWKAVSIHWLRPGSDARLSGSSVRFYSTSVTSLQEYPQPSTPSLGLSATFVPPTAQRRQQRTQTRNDSAQPDFTPDPQSDAFSIFLEPFHRPPLPRTINQWRWQFHHLENRVNTVHGTFSRHLLPQWRKELWRIVNYLSIEDLQEIEKHENINISRKQLEKSIRDSVWKRAEIYATTGWDPAFSLERTAQENVTRSIATISTKFQKPFPTMFSYDTLDGEQDHTQGLDVFRRTRGLLKRLQRERQEKAEKSIRRITNIIDQHLKKELPKWHREIWFIAVGASPSSQLEMKYLSISAEKVRNAVEDLVQRRERGLPKTLIGYGGNVKVGGRYQLQAIEEGQPENVQRRQKLMAIEKTVSRLLRFDIRQWSAELEDIEANQRLHDPTGTGKVQHSSTTTHKRLKTKPLSPSQIHQALKFQKTHETSISSYEKKSQEHLHPTTGLNGFHATPRRQTPLTRTQNAEQPSNPKSDTSLTSPRLTHLTPSGSAHMVNVGAKPFTHRSAIAIGTVLFSNETTLSLIQNAQIKKGDVLSIARIAGIQAAKHCPMLIPLCHPIMLSGVSVDVRLLVPGHSISLISQGAELGGVEIEAKVECVGPTGVEMEALTAVSGAALTVVDMIKAVDRAAKIGEVRVVYKGGGRSGEWKDEEWEKVRRAREEEDGEVE